MSPADRRQRKSVGAPAVGAAQLLASLDNSKFTRRHGLIYSIVMVGHLCDGFDVSLTGYIIPSIIVTFGLTNSQAGLFGSSVSLGMLIGSLSIGFLADHAGRRLAFLIGIGIYSGLSIALTLAWNFDSLVWLRVTQGIGLGAEAPLVFTYLSEFMPARFRGQLVSTSVFGWTFASAIAALLALLLLPGYGWRAMFLVGGIFGLLVVVLAALALPQSVRYLLSRGRLVEATSVSRWLSSTPPESAVSSSAVVAEVEVAVLRRSALDIVRGKYLRYTLPIWAMQFVAGCAFFGLGSWLPSIFIGMGIKLTNTLVYVLIIATAGAFGNVASGFLLDRFGRRNTLTSFFLISGVLMFVWSAVTSTAALLCVGALAYFFSTGAGGGALYTYTSELYPTYARGVGTAWAASWQRIGGIVAPAGLGLVLGKATSSTGFFLLIGTGLLAGAVIAWFGCFETRGRTLEEIASSLT
jgi:MFS transporter, putative metabolite:H+ symporter